MVSVVVPTYNEEKNIKNLLTLVDHAFGRKAKDYEIIVVDDHSQDNTWKILEAETTNFPLKIFKKEVFETVKFKPKSAWTFDLEFLHRASQAGFNIKNIDITFYPRHNGKSHINIIKTGFELTTCALFLKLARIHPQHIPPKNE